eukprot:TRINITY_DN775_c0_g2_i1.p1 TRINITY_DN775_c0_g2~~TRINITY_DN775_c0_g2_i1.p1  ORF type:complete len:282 (-),score=39.73 TRINITY_DN775_c0_g2_i1:107-952(-)
MLAAAGNPQVRIYDINSNNPQPITNIDGHTSNIVSLGFQKDGRWLYTGSEDGTIKVWDLRSPGCQRDLHCDGPVNSVVLHPNQGELISGDQTGAVRVWDLAGNSCSTELMPDGDTPIRSVSVASDASMLVAANNSGDCYVWQMNADEEANSLFEPIHQVDAHDTYVTKCLLSPNVQMMATTSADHTIKIWDTTDFSLKKTLKGHKKWVWDSVFSADSAYLVTASSDATAKLWDVNSGQAIRTVTMIPSHSPPQSLPTSLPSPFPSLLVYWTSKGSRHCRIE